MGLGIVLSMYEEMVKAINKQFPEWTVKKEMAVNALIVLHVAHFYNSYMSCKNIEIANDVAAARFDEAIDKINEDERKRREKAA